MIDKSVNYNDKDFSKHLKGLGLSKEEIKYILGETKRKKFEDGGDSGGDSGGDGGQGDSGPGGSDDGSGHGGPGGPGDSGPGGSDDGTGHGGPGPGGQEGSSLGDAPGTQGGTVGEAQAAAQAEAQSISADDVSMQAQADMEDASRSEAANATTSGIGNLATRAFNAYMAFSPVGIVSRAISTAISNAQKGVTAPDDYSQLDTSVQNPAPSTSPGGGDGGIKTIQAYAPTYNPDTGNPTMDAYIKRLRINLGLPV
jgi:hypothetical protein